MWWEARTQKCIYQVVSAAVEGFAAVSSIAGGQNTPFAEALLFGIGMNCIVGRMKMLADKPVPASRSPHSRTSNMDSSPSKPIRPSHIHASKHHRAPISQTRLLIACKFPALLPVSTASLLKLPVFKSPSFRCFTNSSAASRLAFQHTSASTRGTRLPTKIKIPTAR